ncbi:Capsule synthesis positive regulator AcpB [Bacillus subtilis]|nr:Capsule synthesis positive regulator AcpB [Bacillus subtilis]
MEDRHAIVIEETEFHKKISSLSNTLCGIQLQGVDKIVITILVNCSKYSHHDVDQYKQEMLQAFKKRKLTVYQYVKSFISILENVCNVNLSQDDEFIFNIIQHLKQTIYKYRLIPNIEPPLENSMSIIKQKHFQTFQQVKKVYWSWIQQYTIASFVWEEDIISVTLQIEAVKLLSQPPLKKALLYTEDNFTWSRYIKGVLYHKFGTNLKVELIPNFLIETFDFKHCHADIIITTFPFPKIHIQTIRVSKVPTQRELEDIEMLLHQSYD